MNNSSQIDVNEYSSCPYAVSIFFTTTMAIISSAAFIGNILVIVAVYKILSLRTSTNYYYVNMAVSDFLASLTTWPLFVTKEVITSSGGLLQGSMPNVSCKMGLYLRLVSYIVSSLSLVLIAVDRFIATVFPLKATLITRKVKAALLFATWLIPLAHCIPFFYYSGLEKIGPKTLCGIGLDNLAMVIYYITSVAIYNFAPLIAIIIIYSRIMRALKTRQRPEVNDAIDSNSQQRRSKQIRNVMKIFKSVVVVYFVCICFFGVYYVIQVTLHDFQRLDKCKFIGDLFAFLLPLLSTALNPVILFSLSTNFRQALHKLCPFSVGKCRSCCHVSLQQENISLPQLVTYRQTSPT